MLTNYNILTFLFSFFQKIKKHLNTERIKMLIIALPHLILIYILNDVFLTICSSIKEFDDEFNTLVGLILNL